MPIMNCIKLNRANKCSSVGGYMKLNKLLLPMIALSMIFVSCDVEGDTNGTTDTTETVVFSEDFSAGDSLGIEGWSQNGAIVVSVEEEALKCDITAIDANYDPQIFTTAEIPVINGNKYKLTFDLKADEAGKAIQVNFGDKYDADPWWVSFWEVDGEDALVATTTTDWVTHTVEFTMNETTTATEGCFAANMGAVEGTEIATAVYFDNIKLVIVE